MISLLPLLIAAAASSTSDAQGARQARARLQEMRGRLGLRRKPVQQMHPRLQWVKRTYGEQTLTRLLGLLQSDFKSRRNRVILGLPNLRTQLTALPETLRFVDESGKVDIEPFKKIMPWLAVQLHEGVEYGDLPDLLTLAWWQDVQRIELMGLEHGDVFEAVEEWVGDLYAQLDDLLELHGYDDPAWRRRLDSITPWLLDRIAREDPVPFPDPMWVAEAVDVGELTPAELMQLNVQSVTERIAPMHGMTVVRNLEAIWGDWSERVSYAEGKTSVTPDGYFPRASVKGPPASGDVLMTFPSGHRIEQLAPLRQTEQMVHVGQPQGRPILMRLMDESRIMNHCVGRGNYGAAYSDKARRGQIAIWSLRDPMGYPLVTMEVKLYQAGKPRSFAQIYGPSNSPLLPAHAALLLEPLGPYLDEIPKHIRDQLITHIRPYHRAWRWVLETPHIATDVSRKLGPRDDLERAAAKHPLAAVAYATEHGGSDVLRAGASTSPTFALRYATDIDESWHPVTAEGVLQGLDRDFVRYASLFPESIEPLGLRTRMLASDEPYAILKWALEVDGRPADDTRVAASAHPWGAVMYARAVDKGYHPVTWAGALRSPGAASTYVLEPVTYEQVYSDLGSVGLMDQARSVMRNVYLAVRLLKHREHTHGQEFAALKSELMGLFEQSLVEGDLDTPEVPNWVHELNKDLSYSTRLPRGAADLVPSYLRVPRVALIAEYLRGWNLHPRERPELTRAAMESASADAGKSGWSVGVAKMIALDPGLMSSPGLRKELVGVLPLLFRSTVPHEVEQQIAATFRQWMEDDPDLRKIALERSVDSAMALSQYIDEQPQRDVERIIASRSPGDLSRYMSLHNLSAADLMRGSRRGLAWKDHVRRLSRAGWEIFEWKEESAGGWGRTEHLDYLIELQTIYADRVVEFTSRDLLRRYRRRPLQEREHIAQLVRQARDWASGDVYGVTPPVEWVRLIQRVYASDWLDWMLYDPGLFAGAAHLSPVTPLEATVDGTKIPPVAFVGQLGLGGNEAATRAPSVARPLPSPSRATVARQLEEEAGGGYRQRQLQARTVLTGGFDAEEHGPRLLSWFMDMPRRERRWVADRLGVDVHEKDLRSFLWEVGLLFFAALPEEAAAWAGSDVVHAISPSDTPLVHWVPWTTPRGQVGWLGVYPWTDRGVFEPKEGSTLIRRWGAIRP